MNLFDVYPVSPIEITHGKGSLVWDAGGTEYLDFYGGHAVISIGHGHPQYVERLKTQLDRLGFYSNSILIPLQQQLAELLGKVSGRPQYQLFLCNSGAEANENALKVASFYNSRRKVLSFHKAFHGRTSLAVSCTDNPRIVAPVNATDQVLFTSFDDEDALENVFSRQGHELCAVIIEAIQGVGGIRLPSSSFLKKLRRLCTEYNVVYIADEVQCGYGRSGRFYAHDHAGIDADIYTMAKGMGNGFPVAGIAISPKFEAWHGMLGTTFGGNHLACAAALAVLEVMEQDKLMEHAAGMGAYLMEGLEQFSDVCGLRGMGLMIGIDLPQELSGVKTDLLMKEHIFCGAAQPNVLRLLPALNISREHADRFLDAFGRVLKSHC